MINIIISSSGKMIVVSLLWWFANIRKKFTSWDHFEKVQISESHFKGNGTTNLLAHMLNCLRNPNRDALKAQQTLAFEPIIDGEERF